MSQTQEVRGVATSIRTDDDGVTHINYRGTDVVSFGEKTVTLRSNGWQTITTKLRMNQASNQFGLGFTVYQKDFNWFVIKDEGSGYDWDHPLDFTDGMTFDRS